MACLRSLVFLLACALGATRKVPFFRKDYKQFSSLNAFYKLHFNDGSGTDWIEASLTCKEESAQLFYPKMADDWSMALNMTSDVVGVLNNTAITLLVGIHDDFNIGEYVTVDGTSSPYSIIGLRNGKHDPDKHPERRCVVMDLDSENFATWKLRTASCAAKLGRPFICRKTDDFEPCPTIDRGYIYEREMNKCYKVNSHPKTWHEAFRTCYMEGAMLLVIDDVKEFKVIHKKIAKRVEPAFFIGVYRMSATGNLYTVKGQRLNDEAYQIWYDKAKNAKEDCGVIENNHFKTMKCNEAVPFICEMEAFRGNVF